MVYEGVDAFGNVFHYYYTRNERDEHCRFCIAHTCKQRVETYDGWQTRNVFHVAMQ